MKKIVQMAKTSLQLNVNLATSRVLPSFLSATRVDASTKSLFVMEVSFKIFKSITVKPFIFTRRYNISYN